MKITKYTKVSANRPFGFTCFFVYLLSFSVNGFSQDLTSPIHAEIQSQARNFIHDEIEQQNPDASLDNIKVEIRDIDARIKIPPCQQNYTFESNKKGEILGNMSIKVSCKSSKWYMYLHAKVARVQQVVVAANTLSPGSMLSKQDLKLVDLDTASLRGSTFNSIDPLIGARIKRRVRTGNTIDSRSLCFVCKGDRVTIAAITGGLSIKVYGIAEQDGVVGDTIKVRNVSSNKLVFARVASAAQVQVDI